MFETIKKEARAMSPRLTEWRRWFHRHPELSFAEFGTTARICEIMREIGFERFNVGVAGVETGVTADLNGGLGGRTIALRADIDALPIDEENDVDYKSQNPGVMHACGHDGHAAMLLGAAAILRGHADELRGRVRFIFQPSEEAGEGGAKPMIEEGVLDGVDAIAAIHLWQHVEKGVFAYSRGAAMASADAFRITVRGSGGHGAYPHNATDPVVTAAYMVCELQSIVSREVSPLDAGVITVGRISSGTAGNIIPETALIEGTIRALSPGTRAAMLEGARRVADCVARAHRCSASVETTCGYPPTVNSDAFLNRAIEVAAHVAGPGNVREIPPSMGAEDMGFFLERRPGCFMFLGMADESSRPAHPHHHPKFDVNDEALPIGTAYLASLAWDYLNGGGL
jgi:amidohydrolase